MCTAGYSAEQTSKVIFQVYNSYNLQESVSLPIQFSNVLVNLGNNYDTITKSFKPSKTGYFWFVFDIFTDFSGKVNYWMRDIATGDISGISSSRNILSVLSRSDFRYLQPSNQLQMFSEYSYLVSRDVKSISWGGFNINDMLMNPLIAFSVVQTNNTFDTVDHNNSKIFSGLYNQFAFNVVLVNLGQCWNDTTNTFVAPVRGAYIFSFSANTNNFFVLAYLIIIENFSKQVRIIPLYLSEKSVKDGTTHSISGSEIVMLDISDSVCLSLSLTTGTYADFYKLTSFRGFLYSAPHNFSVIWSARLFSKFESNTGESSNIFENEKLDLTFKDITINIGNVFLKNDSKKVIIPINGVYCITIKASLPTNAIMALFVDESKLLEIISDLDNRYSRATYERSFILHLAVGSSLSLRLILGSILYDYSQSPSLAGFLIAPS